MIWEEVDGRGQEKGKCLGASLFKETFTPCLLYLSIFAKLDTFLTFAFGVGYRRSAKRQDSALTLRHVEGFGGHLR